MKKHQVENFIKIYKKEYGIKLSYPDALELSKKIVTLVKYIYKPIKKNSLYDKNDV